MPIPIDQRRIPKDVKVRVSTGEGIDIAWADGHASHFDFAYLREECPCAMCDDERRKKQPFSPAQQAPATSVLPMYKPRVTARSAKAMGNYAVQIDFNDGHSTGIYSYDFLRSICPCAECTKLFRPALAGNSSA